VKNGDYWKKRMMMLEESSHRSAQETYKEISDALDDAMYQMDSVIEKWLQRIATNNGISMAEARKWLKNAELDEFKWTLEQYIKKGQQNAFDQQWMKELENASARAHITRLEAMEMSLNQYAQEAFGQENKLTGDLLTQIYQDRYGHTAFEIAKGTGVGVTLGSINTEAVKTVLQNPWASDGKIFSDRIWSSMDDMKAELHKQLTRQILTGAAPDAAIKAMTKYVAQGVTSAKYRAGRLVMTEAAAIGNLAQHNCYKELGVEEFEVVATLDGHTCEECGSMDGKHFPMKQFEEGVTAPPFHANCRCVTAPYFADDSVSTRMARNPESGKSEYVSNMTYNEWKEKYIRPVQEYKSLDKGNSQIIKTGDKQIKYSRLINFGGDFNISNKLHIKPRRMHEIEKQIRSAQDKVGIKESPKFILVDCTELPAATLGRYSAVENAIIYKYKETGELDPHMLVHEMVHWKDAQAYIKEHGKIENEATYIVEMSKRCKKKLDRLRINEYNIGEISRYAKQEYKINRFDEAYTEYITKNLLGD